MCDPYRGCNGAQCNGAVTSTAGEAIYNFTARSLPNNTMPAYTNFVGNGQCANIAVSSNLYSPTGTAAGCVSGCQQLLGMNPNVPTKFAFFFYPLYNQCYCGLSCGTLSAFWALVAYSFDPPGGLVALR